MTTLAVLVPTTNGDAINPIDAWVGTPLRLSTTNQRLLVSGSYGNAQSWVFVGLPIPVYLGPSNRVSGYILDDAGAPISRIGYALDDASGVLIATFVSSAIDGSFTFYAPNTNPLMLILKPLVGDGKNSVILDRIVPV